MKDSELFSHTLEYLKEKIKGFSETKRGGIHLFDCPKCGKSSSCTFTLPDTMDMMSCHNCGGMIGDIVAMVRMFEKDKENWPNDEIVALFVVLTFFNGTAVVLRLCWIPLF